MDVALGTCRFAHDAACLLLWGAFGFLAFLVPKELGREMARRFAALRAVAAVVAIATTLCALPIETAAVGNGWPDALDPATLRAVLFETSIGRAWMVQLAAAATLMLAASLSARARLPATAAASGLLLATLALTGHAAMQEGWAEAAHRASDVVHLLAGGAWLGALVPLLPILVDLDDPVYGTQARVALQRFSTMGHAAVALVIATGVANTVLTLDRWPTNWSSPYQALLSVKIMLVGAMTALAVANRYAVVPWMSRRRLAALRTLRAATLAEIVLGFAAVACVSVFGLLDPS